MRTMRSLGVAVFATAIAAAGAVAAVRAGIGGLAVLFTVLGVLSLAGLRSNGKRHPISLRPDLVRWLEEVSATTAEPVEHVLDRSVSAYRASVRRSDDG